MIDLPFTIDDETIEYACVINGSDLNLAKIPDDPYEVRKAVKVSDSEVADAFEE
jgi:hypothetical protein